VGGLASVGAPHIEPRSVGARRNCRRAHHSPDGYAGRDHYPATERDRFLAGLADLDARAQSAHSQPFRQCSPEQRIALLGEMDARAFASNRGEEGWFFRRLKELTIVGYYTSEIGAMQELHVSPFGAYRGDIPYASIGRAWS